MKTLTQQWRVYAVAGAVVTSLISSLHGENAEPSQYGERVIGVKIYDHRGSLPALFDQWRQLGVNTIFSSTTLYGNEEFRQLARKRGMTSFIILPIFFNPDALDASEDLYAITDKGQQAREQWVRFVCPSQPEYRAKMIESIKKYVVDLNPEGLSLDFIRTFVFWEQVYPERKLSSLPITCFDPSCLAQFQADTQISVPVSLTSTMDIAEWIKANHLREWTEWKCSLVTSMVEEIRTAAKKLNPDILINVHLVPWGKNDYGGAARIVAGQDATRIAPSADSLSPMTYAHMLKRDPAWIHAITHDIHQQTGAKVIPSIQVNKAYLADPISPEEFRQSVVEALRPPSRGVVFWSWERLEQDPRKRDLLRDILNKNTR